MCPSRILADDDLDALAVVEWWLLSTAPDPWTGARLGAPEWPFPGGLLRQPARLVDAVSILRAEWPRVMERYAEVETARESGRVTAAAAAAADSDPTKALRVNRRRAHQQHRAAPGR